MAATGLLYNGESAIDFTEKFSLYLYLCQIIEQDKDINLMNLVSSRFINK